MHPTPDARRPCRDGTGSARVRNVHGAVEWMFLLGAGIVAGAVGTAGGITSLVAYPALLAAGLAPLAANVTNAVALLGSGFGSAVRAGSDISGHARTLRAWLPQSVVFSLGGAALLVLTPSDVFGDIVPFLVATGSIVLLVQPAILARQTRLGLASSPTIVRAAGAGVAVYNGYFGAGSGILLIALLLFTTESVLFRANALKNVILVASDILPAVLFAVFGTVVWHAVWPLAAGALVGGLIGPTLARRIPAAVLRVLIAACGMTLAVYLLLS
jgi:uncharacterized protein